MKLHGLEFMDEIGLVELVAEELLTEGVRIDTFGELHGAHIGAYDNHMIFGLQFYSDRGLEFEHKAGYTSNVRIDLYRGHVTFLNTIKLKDIMALGIDDITNIKPHEYGLLKLRYGLEKYQLFIPSFIKPGVVEIQNKIRGL